MITVEFKDGKCKCPICNKDIKGDPTGDFKISSHCEHYKGMIELSTSKEVCVFVWKVYLILVMKNHQK